MSAKRNDELADDDPITAGICQARHVKLVLWFAGIVGSAAAVIGGVEATLASRLTARVEAVETQQQHARELDAADAVRWEMIQKDIREIKDSLKRERVGTIGTRTTN